MDIETVRNTIEQASLSSLAIGLAIGSLFSFNPVALAAIPVSLAYLTKAHALLGLVVSLEGGWI